MGAQHIDNVLNQWENQRPDIDRQGLGIALLVKALDRRLTRKSSQALRRLGLTVWEYDVLSALRRQGEPFALGASELARETHLSSGAMTNRVDRLEARGLVSRRGLPDDRRAVQVTLSASGVELADAALELRMRAADECLRQLDPRRRRQLESLLRIVVDS